MHWQKSRPKSKQLFLPDSLWIFDWTQWVSRSESCCILAGVMSRSNLYFCELLRVKRTMAHHSAAGKLTGGLKARTGTVRSFLSNSIYPHFNFLSFYALLRINVPRLLPLPNRPTHIILLLLISIIKAQPQSSSHMWLLRICLLIEQDEEAEEAEKKNASIAIDVAYFPVSTSSHFGWEFIARGLANEQTPPGEYDKLFETLERRPSHWRQQIRH